MWLHNCPFRFTTISCLYPYQQGSAGRPSFSSLQISDDLPPNSSVWKTLPKRDPMALARTFWTAYALSVLWRQLWSILFVFNLSILIDTLSGKDTMLALCCWCLFESLISNLSHAAGRQLCQGDILFENGSQWKRQLGSSWMHGCEMLWAFQAY